MPRAKIRWSPNQDGFHVGESDAGVFKIPVDAKKFKIVAELKLAENDPAQQEDLRRVLAEHYDCPDDAALACEVVSQRLCQRCSQQPRERPGPSATTNDALLREIRELRKEVAQSRAAGARGRPRATSTPPPGPPERRRPGRPRKDEQAAETERRGPGRPRGSTSKKTASKKTASKKTASKKTASKKTGKKAAKRVTPPASTPTPTAATPTPAATPAAAPKRRGRPPGSKTKSKAANGGAGAGAGASDKTSLVAGAVNDSLNELLGDGPGPSANQG